MHSSFEDSSDTPVLSGDTQDTLVALAREGNYEAFVTLFTMYNGPICVYLARLVGDDETGRDLAQETFLRAWRGLPQLQEDAAFRGWLYRIATNLANTSLRRERAHQWLPWKSEVDPLLWSPETFGLTHHLFIRNWTHIAE